MLQNLFAFVFFILGVKSAKDFLCESSEQHIIGIAPFILRLLFCGSGSGGGGGDRTIGQLYSFTYLLRILMYKAKYCGMSAPHIKTRARYVVLYGFAIAWYFNIRLFGENISFFHCEKYSC